MFNFFKKRGRVKTSAVLLLIVFLFLTNFSYSLAQTSTPTPSTVQSSGFWGWFTSSLVSFTAGAIAEIINFIGYLISLLVGLLLVLAGWFIDFSLALNSEVLNMPVVQIGWRIVRDIANLGFVLGIIVIAFATIIRNQTYGMKTSLFKLIMIAILINFSLSICGFFLDASGILTNFFVNKATNNGAFALSDAIADAFKPQALWSAGGGMAKIQATGSVTIIIQSIASLFFIIIFSWMGVVTYFALGAMLMVRFVHIAFLLILAPIAWLGSIFPGLTVGGEGNIFSKWRGEFIRWTFFPPIVSFFLYLALFTVQNQSFTQTSISKSGAALNSSLNIGGASGGLVGLTSIIGQMFVFCGLLMGGIIAANKLGIQGAVMANKWAHKASGYISSKAKGAAKGTGRLIARSALTTMSKTEGGETTSKAQRITSRLATLPVVGRLGGRKLDQTVTKLAKDFRGDIEKTQKEKYANITNADLINRANNITMISSNIERAAIAMELAARKLFDAKDKKTDEALLKSDPLDKLIDATNRTGVDKDIKKSLLPERPDFANKFKSEIKDNEDNQMSTEEAMGRYVPASKAAEISVAALSNPEVVLNDNFTDRHIENIVQNGTMAQRETIVKEVQKGLDGLGSALLGQVLMTSSRLGDIERQIKLASERKDQAEVKRLQAERMSLESEREKIIEFNNLSDDKKAIAKAAVRHLDKIVESPPLARILDPKYKPTAQPSGGSGITLDQFGRPV
ncbi:MAG TPA: hypothetical protein VJK04_03675 [Candidatus Paceibacterota bacterium]